MHTDPDTAAEELRVTRITRRKGARVIFSVSKWRDPERLSLRVQTYQPDTHTGWRAAGPAMVVQGESLGELIEALARGRDALSACASFLQQKGVPTGSVSLVTAERVRIRETEATH